MLRVHIGRVPALIRRARVVLSANFVFPNRAEQSCNPAIVLPSQTLHITGSCMPSSLVPRGFVEVPLFGAKDFCSSSEAVGRCWSCHKAAEALPFLVCQSCRAVQPVDDSLNYFQIFGLEKNYDIGERNLEGTYKDWQKKLHPDLVHSKTEKEREFAAGQSARINDAYRTLRKPLSRAIYILRLEGVDVDEEKTVHDPSLLAEIMDVREAVEEATDFRTLREIQSQMQVKLLFWSESFSKAFQSRKFEEAQDSIERMAYFDRVHEEIVKKL